MINSIVVDGVRYVPETSTGDIKILVMERGFVYVGRATQGPEPGTDVTLVTVRGARALIRWGTTEHLGQLVEGPLENTKLGASCIVRCLRSQVLHQIEVNQDAWSKHIG